MAQKRKKAAQEDNTSNGFLVTTSNGEKLHLSTVNANAVGPTNVKDHVNKKSNGVLLEKNQKALNMVVRRSGRLKSSIPPSENLGAEPAVEHVTLAENEKEEETLNNSEQVDTEPTLKEKDLEKEAHFESTAPERNERLLEEKVDYLVAVADEFKSKVFGRPNEDSSPNISYRNLYFSSQKKIEALVEENYNLVRKLEFANGKIEVYEKMKEVAAKEVYLVSPLVKATETAATLSPRRAPSLPQATIPNEPKPKRSHHKKKVKQ